MNTRLLLVLTFICMAGLVACGSSEPTEVVEPAESVAEPEAPAAPTEQFIAGQLQEIDEATSTLVLRDTQGADQRIAFSPSTSVTGIINPQTLSEQEGRNATIRYIEQDNQKSALQIHIETGS